MRNFRFLATVMSVASLGLGGVVACVSDDNPTSAANTPDASTSTDSGKTDSSIPVTDASTNNGDAAPSGTAVATAASVYVGQSATLDGSGSTGSITGYAWSFTSVPTGSTITAASLANATTAKPTFTPDLVGTYAFSLTITTAGGTASTTGQLTVADAPIFFLQSDTDPDASNPAPYTAGLRVSGATTGDGGLGTSVLCFATDAGSLQTDVQYASVLWSDWWEAPAGQPSRSVMAFVTNADGGTNSTLLGASSTDTCATPPRVLDGISPPDLVGDSGTVALSDVSAYFLPRFSPDGSRIAYVRNGRTSQIASIGFDGSNPHNTIAPLNALGNGTPDPDSGSPNTGGTTTYGARPVWVDSQTIAWLQVVDGGWQIVTATDANGSTPQVLTTCAGSVPEQFDILPNGGGIIVSQETNPDAGSTLFGLITYTISGSKTCVLNKVISTLASFDGTTSAGSFSLSPDKTLVAYISDDTPDGGTAVGNIRVALVDGSAAPTLVGIATASATIPVGPRWVAGGTALSWAADAVTLDAGDGGPVGAALAYATPDGGGLRASAGNASASTTLYAVGTSTCSFGAGIGSGMSGFGFLGLLALRFTRRRSKKQS